MTDESYDMASIEGCIGWGLFLNPPERARLEAELAELRRHASVPYRCPVCGGNGLVSAGFYQTTSGISTTGGTAFEQCRACYGRGIVRAD